MQNIELQFDDYDSFFVYLTNKCEGDPSTYVKWDCTPNKDDFCNDIRDNWKLLERYLFANDDKDTYVKLMHFEKVEDQTKAGKTVGRLKAIQTNADMAFILQFISEMLSKIVHHRNQLKYYRSNIKMLREAFQCASLDIDFSENLTVPVKEEPQSLHWSHDQITVHSGILKCRGEESQHAYLSDTKKHDQTFVKVVIEEILSEVADLPDIILIGSDNCTSQYKSAENFHDLQEISNKNGRKMIRVYGTAGHGKGEVDNVGGLTKISLRRKIATGAYFEGASEMVDFLQDARKVFRSNQPNLLLQTNIL